MLSSRYEHTGQIVDLEDAIITIRQVVNLTPADHPDLASRLNNLAAMLAIRYDHVCQRADIDEAITTAREAVNLTPADHPDRADYLNNLANSLARRYQRTGQINDLKDAITITRQAVNLTPADHPDRAGYLDSLGNILWDQYQRTGQMIDLEDAITMAREAVNLTPADHLSRAGRLSNLGNSLSCRYSRTGRVADLEDAILTARQAVESTPKDHPDRARYLNNVGNKLEIRYKSTGQTADLKDAANSLWAAWQCTNAIPFHRVMAGARCLKLLIAQQQFAKASDLGRNIIELMPAVSTKLVDRNDQQTAVSTFAGVASNLCSVFLELGRHEDALFYLEQGRAFIIGQLIDRQSDVSDLAISHPDIARRFEDLLREVNAPPPNAETDNMLHRISTRKSAAVNEMMECVADIRMLPGHERFLLGQTMAEMQNTVEDGNAVIINITDFRSDAIIVSATKVETFPLPGLSADKARAWLSKDWTVKNKYKGRRALEENRKRNDEFLLYLEWLWQGAGARILNEIRNESQGTPGRVWWIGSGLAATMPFHAAGRHATASADHACDVASSYTPSIKALAFSRSKAMKTTEEGSLLVATMKHTPKAREAKKPPVGLPGVDEERRAIVGATGGRLCIRDLRQPSAGQVLAALQGCNIAHMACHGYADSGDPSSSHLILQKGGHNGQDAEQDFLTVHRVSELRLGNARLAYLSACSTAQNRVESLSDEVIHLVSGFQVAGFPHVVGCLWPANDAACAEVAREFYKALLKRTAWWEGDHVAKAIQIARMKLREQMVDMPLIWAPFVHYGA